jgi:hypothetical protein
MRSQPGKIARVMKRQGAAWNPAIAADAVLALWKGYDEDAATRMAGFLTAAGRRLLERSIRSE